jgi:ABC-2 type transport system ATP-binding protein
LILREGLNGIGVVIQVENLVKHYGSIKAVDGISFEVDEAEVFGMLGPNGAGKTTTVEIIEGLRTVDAGKVSVLGLDMSRAPEKVKQEIGIQLQAPSLLPLLSVAEILDTFSGFYRHSLPVDYLLEQFALKESRGVLVKNLSGGQQQRLSVAMALVNDPKIAFLDEPTSGLDPQSRRGVWGVLEDMRRQKKTVFLTTHYMDEAEHLCDRVAIIDYGKIIALGSPAELVRRYFAEKAIEFTIQPAPSQKILQAFPGATNATVMGDEVVIYSRDVIATMSALMQFAASEGEVSRLKDLHVREATLEDVFLKLTGRRIRE